MRYWWKYQGKPILLSLLMCLAMAPFRPTVPADKIPIYVLPFNILGYGIIYLIYYVRENYEIKISHRLRA